MYMLLDTDCAETNIHQIWAELFAEPTNLPLPEFGPLALGILTLVCNTRPQADEATAPP